MPNCLPCQGRPIPYPGKLGVVEEEALADLILVDGDLLADMSLLEDPGRNFLVIMKEQRGPSLYIQRCPLGRILDDTAIWPPTSGYVGSAP